MEKAQGLIVNDVVLEVPKPATETTLGTVTLTDDFTYTGAEEHIAVTPKAALLFKQKLDDLVTTGGGMYLRAPTITAPTGDDVAITGAVITASAFAPLVQGATRYVRRFELSKTEDFAELVWSAIKNEDSIDIAVTLEPDVDYYVRVKDFANEGYVSPWSNVHKFNTVTGTPAATPTVTVKEDNIFRSVTLLGSAFAMSDGSSDTHKYTDWKIYNGAQLVWSSLQDSTNLTQVTTPEVLSENTTYNVEVRYYPNVGLPSAVGTTTFKTAVDFGHVATPTLEVSKDSEGLANVPIKVTASAFAVTVGSDTHASTTWKLYKSSDLSTPVWKSEKDTNNLTSCSIPAEINTTYKITCQFHGETMGDSGIAEYTCTTAKTEKKFNYIGIPGTSTFGVGLATEADYNSVQLTPADNCFDPTDFQYGLYYRGKLDGNIRNEGVAMKWICKFYIALLQKNQGTTNLSDSELDALLPYVEVTKEQMKEAQRRSPHNAMVVAPSYMFANEADANTHGFYLMRGFCDGGKEYDGFFISNSIAWATNFNSSVDNSHSGCVIRVGMLTNDQQTGMGLWRANSNHSDIRDWSHDIFYPNGNLSSYANNAKGNFVASCEGTPYQCCSIFAWAVISVLSLIQGQYATDTAQCAWYDNTLVHNYPKGINSTNKDVDDATVTSGTTSSNTGQPYLSNSDPVAYNKTTHNGSITGITNINGWLWQYCIGCNGDGSKLLKHTSSIYDVTYDNVDNMNVDIYEAHSTTNISNQWGGTKTSFPSFTGADNDLFGVYAFGGNNTNNSNEFGTDYHYRSSGYSAVIVGGYYGNGSRAGVFYRDGYGWTDSDGHCGFRVMAYPRVS